MSTIISSPITEELRDLARTSNYVRVLGRSALMAEAARRDADPGMLAHQLEQLSGEGPIEAMLAIESLVGLRSTLADSVLERLLHHNAVSVRRQAAWRLGDRSPSATAVPALFEMLVTGGIDTMHAHLTLRRWAAAGCTSVESGLAMRLLSEVDNARWSRLIALRGALDHQIAPIAAPDRGQQGLRIAQLVLTPTLDIELSRGGKGDIGGVASLLVSLDEAFIRHPDVDSVLTFGVQEATEEFGGLAKDAWEHLPTIERAVRRMIASSGPFDVLHLRMADVATLAGSMVAKEAGLPVCFSLAPDPHNVLAALEARGGLDQASFLALDAETHLWFRARMIETLARTADRLALFPGADETAFLDSSGGRRVRSDQRVAVVAEGIDTKLVDRAREALSSGEPVLADHDVLSEIAEHIPVERRGLPLLVSVGRLHPVKGMDRVVSAWASDPYLTSHYNLVVVGGDLVSPSATERSVLRAIDKALPVADSRRDGLVLLGGRPRADVARVLASAASGRHGSWAGGGVYVDGAMKEEFGLAVLEAMASGLVVVAPLTGGPASYVDDGVAGVLVGSSADLGDGIRRAIDLVEVPGRIERARRMIDERYSIDTMAAQLVDLYKPAMVSL